MNVQKLGLVLGVNMVAACLMMQGCAAPGSAKAGKSASTTVRAGTSLPPSAQSDKPIITVTPPKRPVQPVVTPAPEPPAPMPPIVTTQPTQPTTPTPVVADQPVVSKPPSVRTVKALPPPAPKKPKVKPAAAPAVAATTAQPAATTTEYVVKPGDTLFLISKRTNYRQSAIIAANPGLKPNNLRVGQKIKMPGAIAAPAAAKVAAKADTKPAAKDKDGKVLPAAAPAPAAADTKAPVKTKNAYAPYEGPTKEYVVKGGDSLGKIASESGITIRALKALNGLQKDNLRVGQKLKIPAEKQVAAAKKAPVAAKDSAAKKDPAVKEAAAPAPTEAKKEAAAPAPAPAETKSAAPAADAKPAEGARPAEEVKPAEAPAAPAGRTHVVKEGEDLVQIAINYSISPSVLMDLNDIKTSEEVKPGQVLKLPPNAKGNPQ